MKLHYFIDSIISEKSGHVVAKSHMANSFATVEGVDLVHFYFLTINNDKTSFNKKVEPHAIFIPLLKDSEPFKLINSLYRRSIVDVFLFFKYIKDLSKVRPEDIVYIRAKVPLVSVLFLGFFKPVKFCLELQNYQFGNIIPLDYLYKNLMIKSERLVTVSKFTKDNWVKHGISGEKILVASSGVDVEKYELLSKNTEVAILREKMDVQNNQKLITYAGLVDKDRGIEDIIYCASKLAKHKFLIVGGTKKGINYYKRYMTNNYAQNLDNLTFLGFINHDDIAQYLIGSDLLLAPYSSLIKTVNHMSPLKLFEYMASLNPIVTTDLPRIRDIVSEKEVVFCKPDDKYDLLSKIIWCLNHTQETKKLSLNAYEKAKSFSWDGRARQIIDFITKNRM